MPRLLALYRSSEHAFSLDNVSVADKSVAACTAVLKHHYNVTVEDLKGKKHPALKELLATKLREEKAALPEKRARRATQRYVNA